MRRQLPHNSLSRLLIVPESRLDALFFELGYLFAAVVEVKDTSRSWISAIATGPIILSFHVPSSFPPEKAFKLCLFFAPVNTKAAANQKY
jgi:hypothetical protein